MDNLKSIVFPEYYKPDTYTDTVQTVRCKINDRLGIDIRFTNHYHVDPDLSYLGEWSDDGDESRGDIPHEPFDRRTFDWFIPADVERGKESYDRMAGYNVDWTMICITAEVLMEGIVVGVASISGVESDYGDEALLELHEGLAFDAIRDIDLNRLNEMAVRFVSKAELLSEELNY